MRNALPSHPTVQIDTSALPVHAKGYNSCHCRPRGRQRVVEQEERRELLILICILWERCFESAGRRRKRPEQWGKEWLATFWHSNHSQNTYRVESAVFLATVCTKVLGAVVTLSSRSLHFRDKLCGSRQTGMVEIVREGFM